MGIYDEQIRLRKKLDDDAVSVAFSSIADSVMGSHLAKALHENSGEVTADAVNDVLSYYGVEPVEIPAGITDSDEQIEYRIRPHGIMRRSVKLSKGWYKDAVGAMLSVRTDDDSIVALIPSRFGGYKFFDKFSGKTVKVNRKNESIISDEAMAFYKPYPLRDISIIDVVKFCVSTISMGDVLYYIALTLMVTLVGLLTPKLNNMLFSDVVNSGDYYILFAIANFMICVSISSVLLETVKTLALTKIDTKLSAMVESATMMRILSLPPHFFRSYGSGELSSYATNLNSLCGMIMDSLVNTGITSVFSLIYIYSIFQFAPSLVVPSLIIIITTTLASVVTVYAQMKVSRQTIKYEAKENSLSFALISGIQKIKLSGAESRAFAKWGEMFSKGASIRYNPPTIIKINSVIMMAITMIGTLVMYYFAIASKVSPQDYYAFNTAYGMVSAAFTSLLSVAMSIAQIKPILESVKPILDTAPEISQNKEMVTSLNGAIEIDNVSFRYSEDTPIIIDNLSLKIKRGQYVAIVGATGCGKSTLLRLMLGFEKPLKGTIYYDRKDINNLDLRSLRSKIGVVMQNGKLFMGDIFENITISAPFLTLEKAWEAAEIAGIADDIRRMPMGMSTMISEGQGGISGGQKQRLMIARAVAAKPSILMLDEATSALDNITQKKVSNALDELKCTRIVIAHRLSTIKQADRIIVLDNGKIIEDGKYEDLIAKEGYFKELVSRQMIDEK